MVQVLQNEFPDCEIIVIDVYNRIKSQPIIVARNIFEVIKLYGRDIIARKKHLKRGFWRTPFIFIQMRRLVQEILLKDSYLFSFQMQSMFDASIPGVPHFVFTDHTHLANLTYPNFDRAGLYSQKWINLERTIYTNASLVFVWSSNIARSVIDDYHCPSSKVLTAYIGSNAVVQDAKINPEKYNKKHILFVGIDWERKGGPDLVRAFELLRQAHPDAILTIVGCSPSIDCPNCRVIGRIPVDQVGQYFREASVFCLPSYLEPFGVVFLEAIASRLPIVATSVGAIPDLVQDGVTGFLTKPGDVKGIANALNVLISDPEKSREFGEKGYKLTRDRYSWHAVGKLMKKHILEILAIEQTHS